MRQIPLWCVLVFLGSKLSHAQVQPQAQTAAVAAGFGWIFNQRAGNCVACHSIADASSKKAGLQSTFAPPLDQIGTRYSKEQLQQWVFDARKINPQTMMPPFGVDLGYGRLLTDAQIDDVVAALQSLR